MLYKSGWRDRRVDDTLCMTLKERKVKGDVPHCNDKHGFSYEFIGEFIIDFSLNY